MLDHRRPRHPARRRPTTPTAPSTVTLTPTYSGCPAIDLIRDDVAGRAARRRVRRRRGRDAADAGVDDRLDEPRTAGASCARPASRRRRAARSAARSRGCARLPALRVAGHRGAVPVRLDAVQGAVALPRLPRAVRPLQGALMRPRHAGRTALEVAARATPLTDESIAVPSTVPDELARSSPSRPGQHLTIRARGRTARRSAAPTRSASPARSGELAGRRASTCRAAVLRLRRGRAARRATCSTCCRPRAASGREITPGAGRHHAFVAAGSGITPVISIVATVLAGSPAAAAPSSTATAAPTRSCSSRSSRTSRTATRAGCSSSTCCRASPQPVPLLEGRLDARPARRAARRAAAAGHRRRVVPVRAVRDGAGRPGAAARARRGLRAHPPRAVPRRRGPGRGARRRRGPQRCRDGHDRARRPPCRRSRWTAGSILEAALRNRPDAPYACKGGVCGTCRCRIVEGEVAMDHSYALEEDEVDAGVVLACQAHPRSERIVLDFDAR